MSYYDEVYKKRLNRFGLDYQSRIQGQREKDFEQYLLRSIYRVDFTYNSTVRPAILEPYKQNYLETIGYLLTRPSLILPSGTILEIISSNGDSNYWMVWWLEKTEASGYNRYVALKMTNQISWNVDGITYTQWFYLQGPGYNKIKDSLKNTEGKTLYLENNNGFLLVSSANDKLNKDVYFEVSSNNSVQGFVIREKDIVTTPGVGYYTLDPVSKRDENSTYTVPTSVQTAWLQGDDE